MYVNVYIYIYIHVYIYIYMYIHINACHERVTTTAKVLSFYDGTREVSSYLQLSAICWLLSTGHCPDAQPMEEERPFTH